jgi:glycosyltransferase involved in cell wall biosynthesis
MRILHVGSGFRPWRRGGLVAYVEDLMAEQLRRGDDVSYFFSGRQYPLARGPRLRRWDRDGVAMLEVVNSPLYDHGRQPELEVSEPRVDRILEQVLAHVRPDAVHVQELAGLPSSILDVIRHSGTPAVVTLQDYFPVCSTFKLLDADGRVCTRLEIGADCAATTAADPRDPGLMIEATIKYHARRTPVLRRIESTRLNPWFHRTSKRVAGAEAGRRANAAAPPPAAFQRRRELNVERLNRADCVIAMSHRVAAIYERLGVDPERLRTIHLTLAHIERLTPRRASAPGESPLTFATLAGFESEAKGARLLIEAMRLLAGRAGEGRCRLLVLGHVDPRFRELAAGVPGIEIGRPFKPAELDTILDGVDVGLVPSVWEEAYGYVGVEFMAKGIPVIANAIGGMPDYTRDGETGWLNHSRSADELARIISGIVDRPEQVAELNEKLIAGRDAIVKPMARHADEMDGVYEEAVSARAR